MVDKELHKQPACLYEPLSFTPPPWHPMDDQTPKASASTRTRITREAIQLLQDYANTVTSYPTRTAKTQLLERIHAIPGNESFTFDKISSWFARHRNPAHSVRRREWSATTGHKDATSPTDATPVLRFADDDSILFPSFTPIQLHQLQQLYRNRPDPAEGVITFWATRLKADREEVAAWIEYQRETTKGQPAPASIASDHTSSLSPTSPTDPFSRTHLPTPAKSPPPNKYPDMRHPSLPPVAVKIEESGQYSPSPATPGSANISPVDRLTNVTPITRKPEEALVS
ncbi:hypothetical protein SCLCIDRAFT_678946 [Scleroderma citrinum Foug A]|uniref:Homeobox domain-containing protein n=1 Tax=Scleroderma citrinum Foug A TaxID=1036808 RepID=A0A0C2ZR15_9AGAM|nr:hypothetical protein SCLCIDRAFT_678946 [Scleroderma citrinum Foug A]